MTKKKSKFKVMRDIPTEIEIEFPYYRKMCYGNSTVVYHKHISERKFFSISIEKGGEISMVFDEESNLTSGFSRYNASYFDSDKSCTEKDWNSALDEVTAMVDSMK